MSALQHLRWARFLQLPHEGVEEEVELRGPKVARRDGEYPRESPGNQPYYNGMKSIHESCPPPGCVGVSRLNFAGSSPTLRH